MYKEIDLSAFPAEREAGLKNIGRYNAFDVLYYRSNLWMHTNRLVWLLDAILPIAEKYLKIDPEKTRILALVHDDAELLTGDVQAGHKAHMTKEQLAAVDQKEKEAIETLAGKYPETVHGYSYKELLTHALNKDCVESHLVSYVDKLDAYCETLHELYSGNISLLRSFFFYTRLIYDFPRKFPDLAPLLTSKESPFLIIDYKAEAPYVSAQDFSKLNTLFTKETVSLPSDFAFYDEWKKIILKRGGEEGLSWLTEQKEFIK